MKLKSILTVLAAALAAIGQSALAEWKFTQNEKGELTHYNGIELPPIQTVEEAKAQAQKEIAAAKKAREAQQTEQPATRHSLPATPPQEVFFTGKPYLEETGQYLFLFRHYDPELARWTTADPSGFPDGANNVVYAPVPSFEVDPFGLKTVTVTGVPSTGATGNAFNIVVHKAASQVGSAIQAEMIVEFAMNINVSGWIVQHIRNDIVVFNDDGSPWSNPHPPSAMEFWEAWEVTAGSTVATVEGGGLDRYFTGPPYPTSTYGHDKIIGRVDLYRGSDVAADILANWSRSIVLETGGLFATTTQPTWWTGTGFNHSMTMTWQE